MTRSTRTRNALLAAIACSIVYVEGANTTQKPPAQDWSRWRGPAGNGISSESGWDPAALADGPKVKWQINVGMGYSAICVKGSRLYTMGNRDNNDIVYCLEAATGSEIWRYSYGCRPGGHAGPRATPILDSGYVYTLSREGHVFCLAATDGKVKWTRNITRELDAKPMTWGHTATPCIEGDLLILNAGVAGAALNKTTGKTVWTSEPGKGGYACPVVYGRATRRRVAIFGEKAIFGVDVKDGRQLWSHPWVVQHYVNAADPIIFDNKVFISSGYNKGCALLDISGSIPTVLWQNRKMRCHFSSCVLIDGHLYGIDGNAGRGTLRCLDVANGVEKWSEKTGFGGLIAVDGKLVILNERGRLFIARVSPVSYQEISQGQILNQPKYWTAPVLCDGMIYCRNSRGVVICVDVSGK